MNIIWGKSKMLKEIYRRLGDREPRKGTSALNLKESLSWARWNGDRVFKPEAMRRKQAKILFIPGGTGNLNGSLDPNPGCTTDERLCKLSGSHWTSLSFWFITCKMAVIEYVYGYRDDSEGSDKAFTIPSISQRSINVILFTHNYCRSFSHYLISTRYNPNSEV